MRAKNNVFLKLFFFFHSMTRWKQLKTITQPPTHKHTHTHTRTTVALELENHMIFLG